MLASWRGARLEVIQVLRGVVDKVLKDPGQSEQVLVNRAKVSYGFLHLRFLSFLFLFRS